MRVTGAKISRPFYVKSPKHLKCAKSRKNLTVETIDSQNSWCDKNCFKQRKPLKYCQNLIKLNYKTSKNLLKLYKPVLSWCDSHTVWHAMLGLIHEFMIVVLNETISYNMKNQINEVSWNIKLGASYVWLPKI